MWIERVIYVYIGGSIEQTQAITYNLGSGFSFLLSWSSLPPCLLLLLALLTLVLIPFALRLSPLLLLIPFCHCPLHF